jgi:alpha-D-xyloside xylohydrolase
VTVYPGGDTTFCLYEDEGDGFNYQKGGYSEIPMTWNERSHTLTIGQRKGQFDGMLTHRTFVVRMVGGQTKTVRYSGKKTVVKLS